MSSQNTAVFSTSWRSRKLFPSMTRVVNNTLWGGSLSAWGQGLFRLLSAVKATVLSPEPPAMALRPGEASRHMARRPSPSHGWRNGPQSPVSALPPCPELRVPRQRYDLSPGPFPPPSYLLGNQTPKLVRCVSNRKGSGLRAPRALATMVLSIEDVFFLHDSWYFLGEKLLEI